MGVRNVSEFIITGFDSIPNHKLLGCIILITYCLILLGSSTNICIVASDRHLHTPMYILICNLAIVDIMYTTSATTTMIATLLCDIRTISYYSCISRMFIYHFGDVAECLALSLMAVDRMIAISNPLRYHNILSNKRIFLLIVLSWLISMSVIAVITAIADSLHYCQPFIKYCFCDYAVLIRAACVDPEEYFLPTTVLSLWLVTGQFPFILSTYVKIIYTVLRLSNESRKQMLNTCVSHSIVVGTYFAPKIVVILLTRIGLTLTVPQRSALLIVATLVPSLMNPTVYCFRTKEIRTRLIKFLFKNRISAAM